MTETGKIGIRNYRLLSMLTLGQTPSIPVVSKVPTIILGIGALFGFPEQSDVPSIAAMDGVRESQFNQILIKLLRLASSLTRSGTLKIVVIVVRKTIIPIFFSRDLLTMCYMVLSLTTKYAIQRTMIFYLGTHAGMIGITRQTDYHVLLDQARFLADDLQDFVHSLSYMYQRSTTAIFVMAPIFYAHLAASQLGGLTNNSQDCCWGNPSLMGL
ncbi:hypothetical protein GOBAR_AA37630 [Gossypium barbadense]|uniref:Piwi domain-containing protein n=1 Tax=Gossypium barbadense TaxID=3634 RepID=A0A2P5VW58_GOSBA|nr:hypothetical protein GOBAR_AA37630 [Gossypium barbadense]